MNSKPFEIAAQRLHGHGFELYDKNGVVQIRNNAANRAKHQTIRSIANQRQSIQVLKRKYAPKNTGGQALGNTPESENDFWKWYGELSSEFENLYDEIYNYLAPACDICSIPLDFYKAFKDDDYRVGKWQDVFEKLLSDTKIAKEFYDTFGYGIDPSSGENMTFTNYVIDRLGNPFSEIIRVFRECNGFIGTIIDTIKSNDDVVYDEI